MKTNKSLAVKFQNRLVGTLAGMEDGRIAFEYADSWLNNGFAISPFSLPLEKKVFVPSKPYFSGLFGVFADSLPDAWGNILVNRVLKKNGLQVDQITMLDRLAIVGNAGKGALTYEPEYNMGETICDWDLDSIAAECEKVLQTEYTDALDTLYKLGGTSGGARPKIMTEWQDKSWIIKFPAYVDPKNAGEMEYEYSLCAKKCGITMTETKLFPSRKCSGYFGTVRFDREKDTDEAGNVQILRRHMLTAAALLELDFQQPCMDYHTLMKLTKILTRDNKSDIENMYRRMCLNVFAHNRDDHAKNFTFIYDEVNNLWKLSPAYDMTYSNTYYGEHTTSVDGNGMNPGKKEMIAVGQAAGMSRKKCEQTADEVCEVVVTELAKYLT
ncbi:MAG: type II toxin-antitoxin system HipA family toxin [Suilimivivens sp.]